MTENNDSKGKTDYANALLALSIRQKLNECPICHGLLYDGLLHEPSCRLYEIEEAAGVMWTNPWTDNNHN